MPGATVKISQLPQASSTSSTDELPVSQSGVTRKVNPGQLSTDWKEMLGSITSVTYNGNRSYTLGLDTNNSTFISKGMRFRATRNTTSPTQCADLESSSSHYLNKTSPAGMTFTDDCVAGAWVKLESYLGTQQTIESRFNGTSGYELRVQASSGQIMLVGFNGGSANFSYVLSVASIPLGRWVHVAAQLDMSAFTATSTTSFVMLDGVEVTSSVIRAGTNPTALVQAGDYAIGASNSSNFLDGKVAQAFISSAKITQANIRTLISQGITAAQCTTHAIVSAYSLSNSTSDINTTNANNLTAQNGATTTNSDAPWGQQADGSISSTIDHGIFMSITSSSATIQVPEGCTIPTTSGTFDDISYATVASPYGFPSRSRFAVLSTYVLRTSLSTPAVQWYNEGQFIVLPVGDWNLSFDAFLQITHAGASGLGAHAGLGLSTSTIETDLNMASPTVSASVVEVDGPFHRSADRVVTTATPYYLNVRPAQTNTVIYIGQGLNLFSVVIEAQCNYI